MLVDILQLVQDFLDELNDNISMPQIDLLVEELDLGDIKFDEHMIAITPFGDAIWYEKRNTIAVVMASSVSLANIMYTSLSTDS